VARVAAGVSDARRPALPRGHQLVRAPFETPRSAVISRTPTEWQHRGERRGGGAASGVWRERSLALTLVRRRGGWCSAMVYQPMEKDDSLPLLAGHIVLQKLVAGTTPGWDMFNMIHNFFKAKVKNRLAFSAAYNKCASPPPHHHHRTNRSVCRVSRIKVFSGGLKL
jgi:hypothetical protein